MVEIPQNAAIFFSDKEYQIFDVTRIGTLHYSAAC